MNQRDSTEGALTVVQWTQKLESLYKDVDTHRRPEEFWFAVMAHLSHIGEAIRRTNYPELVNVAAHAFAWMCALANRCNDTPFREFLFKASLSEVVGLKYPNQCGLCMANPCRCDSVVLDTIQDKSARYVELWKCGSERHIDWSEYTIADWLRNFWDIYSVRIHLQSIETIGFHLLEEAGEGALAIRQLIQLRCMLSSNVEGITEDYLECLSIPGNLINEYNTSVKEMRELYEIAPEQAVFDKVRRDNSDPRVLRARLVKAKMNFVVEVADTFSFLCAVLLKVRATTRAMGTLEQFHAFSMLEDELRREYKYDPSISGNLTCYACGQTLCQCLFFPEARCIPDGNP